MTTAKKKAPLKNAAINKTISKKQEKASVVKAVKIKRPSKARFRFDSKQTATLKKLGIAGAANAIRASKALGLAITYLENGAVIKEQANGKKITIANLPNSKGKKSTLVLKKGMIFHANK